MLDPIIEQLGAFIKDRNITHIQSEVIDAVTYQYIELTHLQTKIVKNKILNFENPQDPSAAWDLIKKIFKQ